MFRIDSDGATVDNKFTDTPAPGQNATVVSAEWLNAVQEEIVNFLESNGVTLNKADNTQLATLMAALFSAAKKVAGEYDIETVVIPGSDNKKLMVTNKQSGKQFTITETRGPAGTTSEATHSLGIVAGGLDYIFDFSLHNYSGTTKGVFALSVFNSDEKVPILWVIRRRPTGESGYGDMEDYYLMKLTEDGKLQVNAAGSEGPTPTWRDVRTDADDSLFATAAQGTKADNAVPISTLQNGIAGTYGSKSLTNGETWTIPAGMYMITAKAGFKLKIYSGSTWTTSSEAGSVGGLVLSDGTNFIIYADGVSGSIYYRKLF